MTNWLLIIWLGGYSSPSQITIPYMSERECIAVGEIWRDKATRAVGYVCLPTHVDGTHDEIKEEAK